ncbi:anthranilate synthase, component I [Desulfonatronum thiosulfatophilum]|uniref:Anthranilate synthase, component I n=1 Tax=Desulfonatronum thiosulfatophilum TaxID=617002 RepID=A0A1G6B1M6_9BACT|nr:anthranilate synthase component I family protein [Desulfonatronum thiosulfatophilum]SDB14475.1 anthranilate synthase, component I [Desulfonatronum thiosulfatophilum]
MHIDLPQTGQWLAADVQTPISLFLGLVGKRPGILLESAEVDGRLGRYSLIAWDFRMRLSCRDGRMDVQTHDSRLKGLEKLDGEEFISALREIMATLRITAQDEFADLPPLVRGLYGYFGYGMAGLFEPKLAPLLPPSQADCCLVLPGRVALFDHLHHRCCVLGLDPDRNSVEELQKAVPDEPPVVGQVRHIPDGDEFMERVRRTKELIRTGEVIQTVISTRFEAPFSGEPFVLYRRLRQINPSPYMFFMRLPRLTLLGSSPELLVRCEAGLLQSRPIAGTRPRGETEVLDRQLAEELLADPKERAEHVMLVDLGRNDLGRIAAPGTVEVGKYMQVERFSHVMHMTSYVQAQLAEGKDALDVLQSTFPAGTVSGAPKIRAMEIIADQEQLPRGPYAGAVGWLGLNPANGPRRNEVNLDTGITIRSLWVRDGQVHFQAGAGIVHDSDPFKEWEECHNKARVLLEAFKRQGGSDVFTYR